MPMNRGFRLLDINNKWGETPGDLIVQIRTATLSGSSATITTEFPEGAAVFYLMGKKATVNASKQITAAAAVPGATDTVEVLVFGTGADLTSGKTWG